jgi:hypothetical protein
MLAGGVYYAANFTGALLHGVGGSYMNIGRVEGEALARRFYNAGIRVAPLDTRIHLDLVAISPPDSPAGETLLAAHPYIVHSLNWMRLLDRSIERYGRAPAIHANVIRNGGFDLGLERWFTYGDAAYVLENDVFIFRDLGEVDTSAVVFQQTGVTVSGVALRAQVELANQGETPAEVLMMLHTPSWSQQAGCRFTLLPGAPLAAYTMIAPVPDVWDGAQFAIYSLTENVPIAVDNAGLWEITDMPGNTLCSPPR